MADPWAEFEDAWDEFPDAPQGGAPRSGGPRSGRKYVPAADRAMRDWRSAPLSARMTMGPDELQPGGMEARNEAMADAGAVMTNLAADTTVNLPANVSGFLGKAAGQVARNVNPDIDPAQWRESMTPWSLRTQRGDEVMGEMVTPALEAVERVGTKYPLLGAVAEAGGTALEGLGYAVGARAAAPTVSKLLQPAPPKPYTKAPVADVAKRYTVVPDDVRHSAGLGPQDSMTGSTRSNLGPQVADAEIPVANIRVATQRATQDLPGQLLDANGRVDAGLLEGAIEHQTVPYKQVSQLPKPAANTLAERIRAAWNERGGSLKGDAVAESRLAPLMDAEGPPMTTAELLRRWRELNSYVSGLRKSSGEGSAAAQIKSGDLRSIADAFLDEIDARAAESGKPQQVASLKEARTNIARLHALDDALDSVGWVDPDKLRAMADAHVPLSGGLAEVAADAAAAPRSLRSIGKAVDAQDSQLDRFGREPHSWLRNVVGHMGGNRLARGGIESLNRELRAGSGLLKQSVPPPAIPPLLKRPEPEPPPSLPPSDGPISDELFAAQLRGALDEPPTPLEIQPQNLSQVSSPALPEGLSLGEPDISAMLAPRRTLTDAELLQLQLEPGDFASFSRELNQPPLLGEKQPLASDLGMPVPPRGINEAQLSSPALPRDLRVASGPMDQPQVSEAARRIADMRRPKPLFGPDDEFPDAAAPVAPQGPAPSGGEGGIADMLYRGVPEGADPMAPNDRNFTTWSNQRPVAERYGPTVGEMPFDPATNIHLGTLEDARMVLGLGPEATAQDIAEAAMRRFGGANRTASYDLPPELDGVPREFILFDQL